MHAMMNDSCPLYDGSYSQDSLLIVSPGTSSKQDSQTSIRGACTPASIANNKQDSLLIVSPELETSIVQDSLLIVSPELELETSIAQDSLLIVSPELETSIAQDSLLIVSPELETSIAQDSLLFVSPELETSIAQDSLLIVSPETSMTTNTQNSLLLSPVVDSSQELFVSSSFTNCDADSELLELMDFDPQFEAPLNSTPVKKRRTEDPLEYESESPVSSHRFQCCGRVCIAAFTQQEVQKVRGIFNKKRRADQKQFLFDTSLIFIPSSSRQSSSSSKLTMMLEGKHVCKNAFLNILGISNKRFKTVTEQFSNGIHKATRKPHVRAEASKTSEAKTWMRQYFNLIGDQMPNIDRVHLPHFLTKYDVYVRMKRELMAGGIPEDAVVKVSTFYRFWKEDFSKVLIPSQSAFSKCDICTKFDQERMKSGWRCGFKEEYDQHLQIVQQERRKYYGHREKSRTNPQHSVTIIIDGMDQHKTNLPRLAKIPKSVQGLLPLRTHVTGVLVHTRAPHGKLAHVYIDMLQFPHDCNVTIHVLLKSLIALDHLPPVLNIQLDNTAKENKNKFFLGFCALLVERKIFTKVRVNFLPVGHTHEDIDQLFSRISKQLTLKGAESLPDLQKQITQSSTPTPTVEVLNTISDVRSWLEPCIDGLNGHSLPHCFKFFLEDGKAVMYFRHWSSDAWCNADVAVKLLLEIPCGIPNRVHLSDNKIDLPRLHIDIPKFYSWISDDARIWWEQFDMDAVYSDDEFGITPWPLLHLQEVRQLAQLPASGSADMSCDAPQNTQLQALFAAENEECNVYTGAYRKQSRTDVREVQDLAGLKIDQLLAVRSCPSSNIEPWIAQLRSISDSEVGVVWMEGKYNSKWKVARRQDPENKRKRIEWEDSVTKSSILLYDFQLTSTGHLRKKTIEHLKSVYQELKQSNT